MDIIGQIDRQMDPYVFMIVQSSARRAFPLQKSSIKEMQSNRIKRLYKELFEQRELALLAGTATTAALNFLTS